MNLPELPKPFRGLQGCRCVPTVGEWAVLFSAVCTLLTAGFVLVVDFAQRVHRAFALFLFLRALLDGLLFFAESLTDLAGRLRLYLYIAVPFAALHFALAYRRRHGKHADAAPGLLVPFAILAAALVTEALYLLDHGIVGTPSDPGPLLAVVFLVWPTYAAIGLVFAVEHRRATSGQARMALLLAAVGTSLAPLYFASFEVLLLSAEWAQGRPPPLDGPLAWASAVANLLTLAFVAETARRILAGTRWWRRTPFLAWSAALATAAGTVALFLQGTAADEDILPGALGLWSLAFPVAVTYALVKHRLFDAEVKLRFAIKGTTLATFFLATFLVVGKLTESWAERVFGQNWVVGAVAAGLLLFLITPLQSLADRLARRAVPGQGPAGGSHDERVQLYREQLEIAWADGSLTPKERLLFARLQERLGIPAEEAGRLETEVLAALGRTPRRTAR